MFSKKRWLFLKLFRRLWFVATLYCIGGIFAALIAVVLGPLIPEGLAERLGANSVDSILTILASSMLTVTTFSLSTLVGATTAASSGATPRATTLLLQDSTAQRALSTFLGAFLFSLVGIIALHTGIYGANGRVVLFGATLAVVALIVITMLRWIDHLIGLGNMDETITRIEEVATKALREHRETPYLCAQKLHLIPEDSIPIFHHTMGYLEHLDIHALATVAHDLKARIYITRRPGSYCDLSSPICKIAFEDGRRDIDNETAMAVLKNFSIGKRRSFDQDPRFGLIALSEIASRALSPGMNDPGTAIDVLATLVRVFGTEPKADEVNQKLKYPHIFVVELTADDLIEAAFMPISRDGAHQVEVMIRLQKALFAVASMTNEDCAEAARSFASIARRRALSVLTFERDKTQFLTATFTAESF